jgi:protein-S-isoprenylcysteine O-methyltransferase Ste14
MVGVGAVINIWGRILLRNNWANHIKIYAGHTLVRRGIYRVVRHPLYASIILMLLGGSVLWQNYLSALATVVFFIPAMVYRAKQEERLLREHFPDYAAYQQQAGMFFPKRGGKD